MIKVFLYDGNKCLFGGEELIKLPMDNNSSIWVDIEDEPVEIEDVIFNLFACHALAIKDARRLRHPPKTEYFEDQSFVLMRELSSDNTDLAFTSEQIAFFIGSNFLITRHDNNSKAISQWHEHTKLEKTINQGTIVLFASIANDMGLHYIDLLLNFEPTLSDYEEKLINSPDDEILRNLINHKTSLRKLKRLHNYHDRVCTQLLAHLKEGAGENHKESIHSVIDVSEKFERLNSLSSLYYDVAGDLIDGHISLTSHKLNETMKILTVVTSIFVPLGFLAGVYGMNFDNMPELHNPYGYFILIGVMGLVAACLLGYFKKNKWL